MDNDHWLLVTLDADRVTGVPFIHLDVFEDGSPADFFADRRGWPEPHLGMGTSSTSEEDIRLTAEAVAAEIGSTKVSAVFVCGCNKDVAEALRDEVSTVFSTDRWWWHPFMFMYEPRPWTSP